ncbi:MAG: hypothetical protein ACE5I3_08035 [Phycisphaerae bacterium]
MANGLCARRRSALALSGLTAFAFVCFYGTGPAVAADRMVLAENFTATW